jgi:hypothetical protein
MLKNKLDAKKINYEVCTDVEKMLNLNIKTVPVIQLDNETLMSLREALK